LAMSSTSTIEPMHIARGVPVENASPSRARRVPDISISFDGVADHCKQHRSGYGCLSGTLALVLVIVIPISLDIIHPTEYGLKKNGFTGAVDLSNVYGNGRYFIGPAFEFLRFPAQRMTLSYGTGESDNQGMILARTGPGENDEDSGGQPLSLTISFQYLLNKEDVPTIYETFGMKWESSYLRFAQQAITNVAQGYTPSSFWKRRADIEANMLRDVNHTLSTQGHATVVKLQLQRLFFQSSYEQTITNIQLQEQLKVTKQYQLEATRVEKEVDILRAETTASVTRINAEGARASNVITNEAKADSLQREQKVSGDMYAMLRAHMNWTSTQFLQYVKMKALNAQPTSKVLVGVDSFKSV